jgi:hypothetical protein
MNERARSANKVIMSSKEVLARASKLLTESAQKSSNIRQVEINGQRDHQAKKDLQVRDPKKKHRKPDPRAGPEDYGLYFPDLYRVQGQRNEGVEDSFAKQPASAFEGGRMSFANHHLGDDSIISLQSMRLNNGMASYNERTLDSGDYWDQEVNTRVLLTYFLHALEIERLVFVNKEMVDDAKEIDKELEEADKEINRLKAEKRRVETERDEYKFRWHEASKIIKDEKFRIDSLNLQCGGQMKPNGTNRVEVKDAGSLFNDKNGPRGSSNGHGMTDEGNEVIIYNANSSNQFQIHTPSHVLHEPMRTHIQATNSSQSSLQTESNHNHWGSLSKHTGTERLDQAYQLQNHHLSLDLKKGPSKDFNQVLNKPLEVSYTSPVKDAHQLQQPTKFPENTPLTEESKNF